MRVMASVRFKVRLRVKVVACTRIRSTEKEQ